MNKLMLTIARFMVPIEKAIAMISKREPRINAAHLDSMKSLIQDGDLLFDRCDVYWMSNLFSNAFIPGEFKHVAVYYKGWVFEAVTEGVRAVRLDEWALKKDHVGIGRQPYFKYEEKNLERGYNFLKKQIGKKYEYDFIIPSILGRGNSKRMKAWFCSEYVYGYMLACCPGFEKMLPMKQVLGEKVMTPEDFWNNIMPVATYN